MTQKQGLQKLLDSIDNTEARYKLVENWLEDINWHSECAILRSRLPELERDFTKARDVCRANRHENIADYEFRVADQAPSTFSKIFGYGVNTDEWISGGMGVAFVDELQEMIMTTN